jgi:hypothetical protein
VARRFAALRNPETGRYLIQDFTLANAPSASVLRLLHRREHPVTVRALVLGAPTDIDPRLEPLRLAAVEAREVARLFGTTPPARIRGAGGRGFRSGGEGRSPPHRGARTSAGTMVRRATLPRAALPRAALEACQLSHGGRRLRIHIKRM